jgi:hypothetical protein
MTSQGSARARFGRAIATGNPTIVLAAAAELGQLTLADALAVTLVLLPADRDRYERAAVRWHARWCIEARPLADESQLALAALRALGGPARQAAADALVELLTARGPRAAARVMADWVERAPAPASRSPPRR